MTHIVNYVFNPGAWLLSLFSYILKGHVAILGREQHLCKIRYNHATVLICVHECGQHTHFFM